MGKAQGVKNVLTTNRAEIGVLKTDRIQQMPWLKKLFSLAAIFIAASVLIFISRPGESMVILGVFSFIGGIVLMVVGLVIIEFIAEKDAYKGKKIKDVEYVKEGKSFHFK